MNYTFIFFVLILLFLLYMRFEASLVEVKNIRFSKSKNCLKFIQLSDIHISFLRVSPKKVRNVILNEKPDFIVITGDFIEKASQIQDFLSFLSYISNGVQTYLCLGNHDFKAFLKKYKTEEVNFVALDTFIHALEGTGASVLHNRTVCFRKGSKNYNITGIGDLRYKTHDLDNAFRDACKGSDINIAISHNPDIVLEIPRGKVDYLFCGHFHGGQIWAPFNIEFSLMRKEKLCKMGIRRGLHKVNGINLYINKGLGNVCFPLRFMSRPEITVFYLP